MRHTIEFCWMDYDMNGFAQRLKEIRESRGLTQISLAELVDVSPRVYNRWERGNAVPRLDFLVRLADILQVTLDELTGREDLENVEFRVHNPKLHRLYRQVDKLSEEDQGALVVLLDSLIKRSQVSQVMAD